MFCGKFRKSLGRSVNEEIKEAHCNAIAEMLEQTDKSVFEIAYELGHPDGKHISRYFKNVKGFSPLAWRKRYLKKQGENSIYDELKGLEKTI